MAKQIDRGARMLRNVPDPVRILVYTIPGAGKQFKKGATPQIWETGTRLGVGAIDLKRK